MIDGRWDQGQLAACVLEKVGRVPSDARGSSESGHETHDWRVARTQPIDPAYSRRSVTSLVPRNRARPHPRNPMREARNTNGRSPFHATKTRARSAHDTGRPTCAAAGSDEAHTW